MSNEIRYGEYLNDYVNSLKKIKASLEQAKADVDRMEYYIYMCMYIGDAREDIQSYTDALREHIVKMNGLYTAGISYLNNVMSQATEMNERSKNTFVGIQSKLYPLTLKPKG